MDRNFEVYNKKCFAFGGCYNVCPVDAIELSDPNTKSINEYCAFDGKLLRNANFKLLGLMIIIILYKDTDL